MSHTVAVFGATGGIGTDVVRALIVRGANVAAVGRSGEKLQALFQNQEAAQKGSGSIRVYTLEDAGDPDAVHHVLDQIEEAAGPLTAAVSTLGAYEATPLAQLDLGAMQSMIEHNLLIPTVITAVSCQRLAANGGGRLVNISSITATVSRGNFGGYEAAKAGLVAMSRSAAIEFARSRVAVNTVSPGWVYTAMGKPFIDAADPSVLDRLIPVGRPIDVEEISEVVSWLAVDAPVMLTAQNIIVDGGQTAHTEHLHA